MPVKISTPLVINGKTLRNRIIMPPLVCANWADDDGMETVSRAEHYGRRAEGGVALIVVEATAISKESRLDVTELGLWSDDHIDQFRRIARACHDEGALAIVQLVHAGAKAVDGEHFSASASVVAADPGDRKIQALDVAQISDIASEFAQAAIRARKAGLDGVEIHGAHGYLLNQFTSSVSNRRADGYGGTLDGRFRFPLEVTRGIRAATGPDFLVAYRFGVNDPTLDEDACLAEKLAEAGVDFLDASAGIGSNGIAVPGDFPFTSIAWMGCALRKRVRLPVACVNGIARPEQAAFLLENDMIDLVAVGRGLLSDAAWVNKAIAGESVDECLRCKPGCKYHEDGHRCPVGKANSVQREHLVTEPNGE